ncbi:DoxX-like family protein [Gordonia sp. Swx-4]|uniref:DoxX family protein n=1 Tax=Gordonia sp. Swx-4 TaxID=3029399 RepID=UPI0025739CFE|nr:DoxX-like family protein [Gordonia sp. Swx-4]WJG12662.1 DoxX-like family protein [Gordonia sp. Swx-4]
MTTIRKSRLNPLQLARGLAVMLLGIGVLHFVAPKPFDEIIPEEIPGDPRTLTYLSGVAEIGLGAGLLVPRTRRLSAALSALLFLAVYPANLNMVRLWWDKPLPYRIVALTRLPFQFPMIWAAIRVARED